MKISLKLPLILCWIAPFAYLIHDQLTTGNTYGNLGILLVGFVSLFLLIIFYIIYALNESDKTNRLHWGVGSAWVIVGFLVFWYIVSIYSSYWFFRWREYEKMSTVVNGFNRVKNLNSLSIDGENVYSINAISLARPFNHLYPPQQFDLDSVANRQHIDVPTLHAFIKTMRQNQVRNVETLKDSNLRIQSRTHTYLYSTNGRAPHTPEHGEIDHLMASWYLQKQIYTD
ncbi:MAG: hypothetical protein QM669_07905 [Siphonobacter sp.]